MKVVYKLILLFALIIFQLQSFAQGCSTCRAQIISSTKDDLTIGNGLNTGILSPFPIVKSSLVLLII